MKNVAFATLEINTYRKKVAYITLNSLVEKEFNK